VSATEVREDINNEKCDAFWNTVYKNVQIIGDVSWRKFTA